MGRMAVCASFIVLSMSPCRYTGPWISLLGSGRVRGTTAFEGEGGEDGASGARGAGGPSFSAITAIGAKGARGTLPAMVATGGIAGIGGASSASEGRTKVNAAVCNNPAPAIFAISIRVTPLRSVSPPRIDLTRVSSADLAAMERPAPGATCAPVCGRQAQQFVRIQRRPDAGA